MSEVHQVIRRCVSLRAMSEEDLQGKIWDRPHLSGPSIWNDDDLKIAKSNDHIRRILLGYSFKGYRDKTDYLCIGKTFEIKSKVVARARHMVVDVYMSPGNVYGNRDCTRVKLVNGMGWITLQDAPELTDKHNPYYPDFEWRRCKLTEEEAKFALQPFPKQMNRCRSCHEESICRKHESDNWTENHFIAGPDPSNPWNRCDVIQRWGNGWDDNRPNDEDFFQQVGRFVEGSVLELDSILPIQIGTYSFLKLKQSLGFVSASTK